MNWEKLTDIAQLETIKNESKHQAVFIFKHSTRCSISAAALGRIERNWKDSNGLKAYFLDLLTYRDISNKIAIDFKVAHESPQALLIKNTECVYDASHMGISIDDILRHA